MNHRESLSISKLTSWKIWIDRYLSSNKWRTHFTLSCSAKPELSLRKWNIIAILGSVWACFVMVIPVWKFSRTTIVKSQHPWVWWRADWSTSTELLSSNRYIWGDDARYELGNMPNVIQYNTLLRKKIWTSASKCFLEGQCKYGIH